ncbi:MAG: carbohydrate ABC transporter permease [Actinobacteria bacterium]|nr:carbohydrate ABC transporter permease [Actinomycetota bacterium]
MTRIKQVLFYSILTLGAIWMLFPFLWMLSTSFKTNVGALSMPPKLIPDPFTWANYRRVAEVFPVGRFFLNSVLVSVAATLGQILTASMAAYAFSRMEWKGRDAVFLVYLGTLMIPQQVTLTPLFILMRWLGWTDTYQALIFPGLFTAFGTFLLRQYFLTLPRALEEAAFVDGASHWTVYWRIVLPLAKPALSTLAVFSFMGNWNSFLWPLVVTSDPKLMTLPVGLANLQGRWYTDWNLVMAGAVINVLPMVLVYLVAQKQFIKGVTMSGIKG